MNKNKFKCDLCEGVFKKAYPDKELEPERAIVCDNCCSAIRRHYNPWINRVNENGERKRAEEWNRMPDF